MSLIRMTSKLSFYSAWMEALTPEEQASWLGPWVRERVDIYLTLIRDTVGFMEKHQLTVGNYQSTEA